MTECIICLEKNNIYNINHISCIKKDCDCDYFCHISCVKDWIYDNPTCLLCYKLMYVIDNIESNYTCIHPSNDTTRFQMLPIPPYIVHNNPHTNIANIHTDNNSYSPPPQYESVIIGDICNDQNIEPETDNIIPDQDIEHIDSDYSPKLCCQYIVCIGTIICILLISSNFFS